MDDRLDDQMDQVDDKIKQVEEVIELRKWC